jgi:hypothetical protein
MLLWKRLKIFNMRNGMGSGMGRKEIGEYGQ